VSLLNEETCEQVEVENPNDVRRLLFKNVNSLELFLTGRARGQKLKQMRPILKKWGVAMTSFVEAQTDCRHTTE
jgi:hypothetical protein